MTVTRASLRDCLQRSLGHRLSPVPLVVTCVGFWLPISFLERGNALLALQPMTWRLHVMATAVMWNLVLSIAWASLAYLSGGFVAVVCRVALKRAVEIALRFSMCLAVLVPSVQLLKIPSLLSNGWWKEVILVALVALTASWITFRDLQLSKYLFLPKLVSSILLPLSALFVTEEALGSLRPFGSGAVPTVDVRDRPPDIILLTVDTLSARHLHAFGYQRFTTPNLDILSTNAIVFDNFYANGNWTRPGIASILNGVRPWTSNGDIDVPPRTLTEKQNLLSVLHSIGYDVNVVQSMSWADFGSQGIRLSAHKTFLDSYYRVFWWLPIERLPSAVIAQAFGLPSVVDRMESECLRRSTGKNLQYIPAAEALLHQTPVGRPLFFWLHVIVPHDPYAASAPFLGVFNASQDARTPLTSQPYTNFARHISKSRQSLLEARYDEAILQTDDLVGRFIQMLKEQGRFERSLLIVTADHGESFHPLYGMHGGPLLTEDLIRVPCFIKPPSPFTPKHDSRLMEQIDLLPTILSYTTLAAPVGLEGHAYYNKPDNLPAFSMNRDLQHGEHTLSVAMRDGNWKYVIHLGLWRHPWPQQELYNLVQDPSEKANLIDSQPERAAAMRQRVLAEVQRHGISLSEYQP